LLSLRISLRIAQELSKTHDLIRVEPAVLERWLERARIDEHPIDRIPPNPGHGIMVALPPRLRNATDRRQPPRRPRLARRQRLLAAVLNETETLELFATQDGKD